MEHNRWNVKKLKQDLEMVLPQDAAACDACVARVLANLQDRTGITDVHIDTHNPHQPKLCLHYDPNRVRLESVKALVTQAGAELSARFEHLSESVSGLRHQRQAQLVEDALLREKGVLHAAVAFGSSHVYIEFEPTQISRETLIQAITHAGLQLRPGAAPAKVPAAHAHDESKPHKHDDHDHAHGGPFGARSELVFSLTCGVLTGLGWSLEKLSLPAILPIALFVLAYGLGSWFTVQEVFVALRARKFEIDFLMLVAALGAAAIGQWFEGALLLFLFTLGHALEGFAMRRARQAIEALSKLVPATALKLDDAGGETEVPIEALALGDRILVKPNTSIPVDGFVLSGTSSVNQAPITGESIPADKQPVTESHQAASNPEALAPENRVFAGTINGAGALTLSVMKRAGDSTLARVVKLVSEAETQKSSTQHFTDRFERVFVPVILLLVFGLLFAWMVLPETFAQSFYRAMAVLVAASPCALAIATPSAVLAGVARAAKAGVLIKGGAHLESLGMIKAIAFDKTGTLTQGKPQLTDIVTTQGTEEQTLLAVAWAVEKKSDHPLASAIVAGARARLGETAQVEEAQETEAVIGFGVRSRVGGQAVVIGKPGLFSQQSPLPQEVAQAVEKLQAAGRTVMVVQQGERFLGVLGVMDTPRDSARKVIAELYRLGIEQTIMLTGDNQRVADAVAKSVGISLAKGDLLPEQKVDAIKELARSANKVAMVGDGVNDSPAMAHATVGIAMGAGGSDVALETADIALMGDDLLALPFAVGLSRAARGIIRQNLCASLGMVAFLVPATLFGFAGIGLAVVLHEGSTLLVVANALRLLAYQAPRQKI